MERLVKGLLEVALGGGDDDQGRREDNDQRREEHSRSTWSEVVSENQEPAGRYGGHRFPSEEQNFGRKPERYEQSDLRPLQRPQNEEGEDAWNTVGRKEHGKTYEGREEQQDGWNSAGRKQHKQQHPIHMDQWNKYKRQPSKQNYGEEYGGSERLEPSQEELNSLSQACNRLWDLDTNRLIPGKDYLIDCGDGKKVAQKGDMAEGNLFSWVDENVMRRPTYSRFCSLLDNYNPYQGTKEVVSAEEKQEQVAFIEEISRTAPIKYLHNYLTAKGVVSENYQDFKRSLTSLWFDLYGRGGTSGSSSAFEHVFVGEIKDDREQEVSGFHNWLQFYLQESNGKVDYRGYIFPRRRGDIVDADAQLLTVQFEWNGVLKAVSSTLVGVSPEMEIALYTLCYYVGEEDNYVDLGPYPVNIKCYRHGDRIGSVFPIANS